MKILICGHSSFASQGVVPMLRDAGHQVVCFGRGSVGRQGDIVTGPVASLHENPHLAEDFEAVLNYILLKDEDVATNEAFAQSVTTFCAQRNVKHLVHISSVSSYRAKVRLVNEEAELEDDPTRKGSYGSLKVASDLQILRCCPAQTKLSMIRPGFILGKGLIDPIIGTGVRAPWNKLMVLGTASTTFPIISRATLNQVILKVLTDPPAAARESLLLVADNSPTRREYLEAVARELGAGQGVSSYPTWLWWMLAAGSEVVARMIGQSKLKPFSKLGGKLRSQRFDSKATQARVAMNFDVDWKRELVQSLEGQTRNFELPYDPLSQRSLNMSSVSFLGFGRIVKQKHLPALKRLGFSGTVAAFDLHGRMDPETGHAVKSLLEHPLQDVDLHIVASPGPSHADAIDRLAPVKGTVLVEKPLCYGSGQLEAFRRFGQSRPVLACHNYRYKENVRQMLHLLLQRNPGALRHVQVYFQSPPASNDSAAWLRNERRARTLLMDYAIHFLDLACMFGSGVWEIQHARRDINSLGQTDLIEGSVRAQYSVGFLFRQGFAPRRTRILYSFQNYSVSLGFFPETFVPYFSHDNAHLYKLEKKAIARATRAKVFDKLLKRDRDPSHDRVIADAACGLKDSTLSVDRVAPFYEMIFKLAEQVYDEVAP